MTQIKINDTCTDIRGGVYGSDAWICRLTEVIGDGIGFVRYWCEKYWGHVSDSGKSGILYFTVTEPGIYEFRNFCIGSTSKNHDWSGFCELTTSECAEITKEEAIQKINSGTYGHLIPQGEIQ